MELFGAYIHVIWVYIQSFLLLPGYPGQNHGFCSLKNLVLQRDKEPTGEEKIWKVIFFMTQLYNNSLTLLFMQ